MALKRRFEAARLPQEQRSDRPEHNEPKALLKKFGAPVSDGAAILSANEIPAAVSALPGPVYVVKSQIHAGGRGKGTFKELGSDAKGGVRVCFSPEEAVSNAQEMFGKTLVTQQTGPEGKQVNRLYIEDGADIDQELYLSILVPWHMKLLKKSIPSPSTRWQASQIAM